ncbi:MAG: hypothetical protein P8178_16055, partial [Candidatus Thiodiazotropha sp.]
MNADPRMDFSQRLQLQSVLHEALQGLSVSPPPALLQPEPIYRRRRLGMRRPEALATLALVEDTRGILRLREEGVAGGMESVQRRAARLGRGGDETVIDRVPFQRLQKDQVRGALEALDAKLTPHQGIRRLQNGMLQPLKAQDLQGRILLLVHGTFSNTDNLLFEGIAKAGNGAQFLADVQGHYDHVLSFDHPTLSVDPVVNARQLAVLLNGAPKQVDIVCHSRGGLVTRWFVEAMERDPTRVGRVVYVGSPLAGTSLAAAPSLRSALDLLANIGKALGAVSAAVPFLSVATGLFQVFTSVSRFLAKTPVADAAIALVPGLRAQSRVSNNHELQALRLRFDDLRGREFVKDRYFMVQSNFEPKDPGWHFWKYFRGLKMRAADLGADAIFTDEQRNPIRNDLVVDVPSMTDLHDGGILVPKTQICD